MASTSVCWRTNRRAPPIPFPHRTDDPGNVTSSHSISTTTRLFAGVGIGSAKLPQLQECESESESECESQNESETEAAREQHLGCTSNAIQSREREREPTVAFGQVNNESKAKKTRSGMFLNNGIAKMNDRTRWRGTDISQTFEPGLRAGQIRTATISRAKMGAGIKGA